MKRWSRPRASFVLAALLLACSGKSAPAQERQLVVFAAASLREAFTALGAQLEQAHPGLELRFNFAGSQELRTQIEQGAAADVFASADLNHMAALERKKRVLAPRVFAQNEPVVVVSDAALASVRTFAGLSSAARIVLGAEEVPIGRYSREILERASRQVGPDFVASVEAHVVSRELNVRQVLAKVSLGEADAGIVYRSDVKHAERVSVVEIPHELNVIASYPIAVTSAATHPALAREFVALVLSARGRAQLGAEGFLPPP